MPDEIEEQPPLRNHFELFGKPLRDYSFSRRVAAQTMGVKFPSLWSDDDREQFNKTRTYAGMMEDTFYTLWLCDIPDPLEISAEDIRAGAWTPTRARQKPQEAREAAFAWAEAQSIGDVETSRFSEAYQTFLAIATRVDAASFRVVLEDPSPGELEPGKV